MLTALRSFRRGCTTLVVISGLACLTVPAVHAQVIRGYVRDSASGAPIARAQVVVEAPDRDSVIMSSVTSDSGSFVIPVKKAGSFRLLAKRLGWSPIMTSAFALGAGDTLGLTFNLARHATALDTVVRLETRGVFVMTPGREYVRRHFALGVGTIVSGAEIEKTGLSLSAYLGKLAGLSLAQSSAGQYTPVIPAIDEADLTSDFSAGCLIARIDRQSVLYDLMVGDGRWIDDVLKLKDVMAVEVYLDRTEVPKEWVLDAHADTVYWRNFTHPTPSPPRRHVQYDYAIAQVGGGLLLSPYMVKDDSLSFGTKKLPPAAALQVPAACGFMQIWTGVAW